MDRPKKRPRPTLSCRECRQKKLRCDRAQPCQQCLKGQREALCVFDQGLPSHPSASQTPENPESQSTGGRVSENERMELEPRGISASQERSSVVEDLQARVASLEAVISANRALPETPYDRTQQPVGTLSIKGDRCRYYGNGYQDGLYDRVRSTATSILQPSTDPELWSLAKEVQDLIKRRVADMAAPSTSKPNTLTQLRDQLPEPDVCHSLIRTYFSLYEERLAILHRPTFMPLFSSFMANQPPERTSRVEPQIYAAMALAAHHLRASSHIHQSAASAWLRLSPFAAIEAWLTTLPRRARTSVPTLQTRALLVLAQQARGQHVEEHWQATNALVRAAMVAGLHRDPTAFATFSTAQGDLRRRLWWSVVEMDVGAALAYGMPPALCAEDTDCMPGARPDALDLRVALGGGEDAATGFVLQDFLARSLSGRLGVANVVCRSVPDQASRVGLRQLWDGVEDAMRDLPPLECSTVDPTDMSAKAAVASLRSLRGAVAISVQRSLSPENVPGVESIRGAADILSSLILLAPEVEEINAPGPYLSKFIVEFMQDIYKAMTLLSKHLDRGRDAPETSDPSLQAPRLFQLLGESLHVFINNVALEHTTLKSLFALSVSASLAKARSNGEVEKKVVREGLMETLALLQRRFPATTKSARQPSSVTTDVSLDDLMHSESAFDVDSTIDWPSSDWLKDIDDAWF
ncbi:hypothetical protein SLS58_010431 [Diplodia intermedia]|uniref:Zn(2)-C6 fungal-type domain-containing protein n=1 Tax=Diplodia intermedia TaxID=856260 RepID=A0ABR3T6P2_9PEZI